LKNPQSNGSRRCIYGAHKKEKVPEKYEKEEFIEGHYLLLLATSWRNIFSPFAHPTLLIRSQTGKHFPPSPP
jgi:hypothetical protein